MEGRGNLSITGVEDVAAFNESQVALYTIDGMLIISGAQLNINKLSLDSGELTLEGIVDSLEYTDQMKKSGDFFTRLFG